MRNLNKLVALVVIATSMTAWANGSRTLDGALITNGAATLTLPTSTDTLVGRNTTDTLTAKTLTTPTINGAAMSGTVTGSPTFSGAVVLNGGPTLLGAGSISSTMNHVDSSDNTKQLALSLSGLTTATTTTLSFSGGAQTLTFPAGSGTIATLGATQTFGASSTWNGAPVGAQYGGTGLATLTSNNLLVGNGTGNVTFIAPGTSGNVLTSNGTTFSSQPISSAAPSLNGGSGAAESIVAGTGVTLSSITYSNMVFIKSNTAGNTTVTATPSVTVCTNDGQKLNIIGTDATKTVTLQDQANLASSGLSLNGNWVGGKDSALNLHWDATQALWVEDSRR